LVLATGVSASVEAAASNSERSNSEHPVRVATLLPYAAEALAGFEAAAVVIANVARPGESVAATQMDLGMAHEPNLELLATVRADLIIGDRRLHATLREQLGRFGGDVLLVDASSVQATFDGLLEIGRRVGLEKELAARVAAVEAELAGLRLSTPVTTLPLFGAPGTFLAITPQTWLGDLLARLDFDNLASSGSGHQTRPGYVSLSDEVLASSRPRLVLLMAHGDADEIAHGFRKAALASGGWAHLADRVHLLDPRLFAGNPGLRMGDAGRVLVALATAPED
jgi:ABC-type Fe3+-citrate transport system substrate-binding protein